jgi:hypothetical protein
MKLVVKFSLYEKPILVKNAVQYPSFSKNSCELFFFLSKDVPVDIEKIIKMKNLIENN